MSESSTQQNKSGKFRGGELLPGTVLDQRLEVVRRLSRGVKESVYLCKQLVAPYKTVVLKLLPKGRSGEDFDTTYARFQREIVALYSISHPNVVNVYEAINDGDVFGYTMEYVEGGNLDNLLEEGGELPFERIIEIMEQVGSALAAIHEAGIIHRSLKPKNILLSSSGAVKVTDFAVAKVEGQKNLTSHGTIIGTMEYVSPEYVTKGFLDKRLDIYSLGVIGYEMITGTTPFQSEDFIETLSKRASMDPEPPHRLNPACPTALSSVIMRAIARDPEERYQTVSELLADLLKIDLDESDSGSFAQILPQIKSSTEQGASEERPTPSVEEPGFRFNDAYRGAPRAASPSFDDEPEDDPTAPDAFSAGGFGQERFQEPRFDEQPFEEDELGEADYGARYEEPRYSGHASRFGQPPADEEPFFGAGWDEHDQPQGRLAAFVSWMLYAGIAGGVGFGLGYAALLLWWKVSG